MLDDATFRRLLDTRAHTPEAVAEAARSRHALPLTEALQRGDLLLLAVDHPARGALRVGSDPAAMADRRELLGRILLALDDPRVDGVLGTADIIDDLLLLGALDRRLVIGSMNRSGLTGAVWELDDRMTGYDAAHLAAMGFTGGKMLLRIDPDDPGTNPTLAACAAAVTALADRGLMAMVEPLPATEGRAGNARVVLDPPALVRAVTVASGLGASSAHTWLKLPATDAIDDVLAATTLPVLLLGGDPGSDPTRVHRGWARALRRPQVRGLVAGRTLLYPPDGDVPGAIAAAAALLRRTTT